MKPIQTDDPAPRLPRRTRADWLAWSAHLLLGLAIGAAAGVIVAWRLLRFQLIADEQMGGVMAGVALFGGAITSCRGNRAWFYPSVFDAEEPPQSRTSRVWSLGIGGVGIGLVLFSVYRHLQAVPWHPHPHSFSTLDIPMFGLLALLLWLLVHALRTGTALGRYGIIYRDEAPSWFWLYVALTALSILYILGRFFR